MVKSIGRILICRCQGGRIAKQRGGLRSQNCTEVERFLDDDWLWEMWATEKVPLTKRSAEYSATPAALEARHVYWPPFSGVTESMTRRLVRWPTRTVETPSRVDTLDPRKYHWTSIGRSPSVAIHVSWVADPANVASSPKLNGAIFGPTNQINAKLAWC